MLTALIAEDELLVRLGISSSVSWAELDVAVIGEVENGLEAWTLYQKYHPDIVIIDLLMPGMNGMELLQRIRAVDQHCAAIVVTNVDSEETLDEVRALGVSGILAKMSMKRDDISAEVRKVCDQLRQETDGFTKETADRKKSWENILSGNEGGDAPFEAKGLTGIRLFPNERLTPPLQRSLSAMILQRLNTPEAYSVVSRDGGQLLVWKDLSGESLYENVFRDFAQYVRDCFHIEMGTVTVNAAASGEQLAGYARLILDLLRENRLFDDPVLRLNEHGHYMNKRLDAIRGDLAISLPVCREPEEMLALKIYLDRFPGHLSASFERLVGNAAPLLRMLGLTEKQTGLGNMTRLICEKAEQSIAQTTPKLRPEIRKAMTYMHSHLRENLTREGISKFVSYESAYFSRLFKTETGISYTDYLQQLRILRARELLCETDASISEIADQCGFSGSSYFSGCFRQLTGMTLHEWRENHREAIV